MSDKTRLHLSSANRDFVRKCAKEVAQQARETNSDFIFNVSEIQTIAGVNFYPGNQLLISPEKPIRDGDIVCALVDGLLIIALAGDSDGEIIGRAVRVFLDV
jgi:SOS-response transcriptional repressor LexA